MPWLVLDSDCQRFSGDSGNLCPVTINLYKEDSATETHFKTITKPARRDVREQVKNIVFYRQAGKAPDNRHPGARHAGDVKAILRIIVIIIQVKPSGSQVHFHSFIHLSEV